MERLAGMREGKDWGERGEGGCWWLRVGKGGVVFAFGYNLVSLAIVNVI